MKGLYMMSVRYTREDETRSVLLANKRDILTAARNYHRQGAYEVIVRAMPYNDTTWDYPTFCACSEIIAEYRN